MSLTVDHLAVHRRVRVIRGFTDGEGRTFAAGYAGVITGLELDRTTFDITMTVDSNNGGRDTMRFRFKAVDGPGNGRMRDYFEVGEMSLPPRERRPGDAPPVDAPAGHVTDVPIPPLRGEGIITDPAREEEALEQLWALAARRRFGEAREQLLAINGWPDPSGERARSLAGPVGAAAIAHAWDDDATVYKWLRDWSINLWYQWGSGATSGGDGSARAVDIRKAEAEWAALDERRHAFRVQRGLPPR